MKEIFVNGRFFSQPVTGAQRYGHELLTVLDFLLKDSETSVTILVPKSVSNTPNYSRISVRKVGTLSGQLWEQIELPFYSRKGILLTLSGGAPIVHRRNIITIHDAAVVASPMGYSWIFRTWYRLLNWTLCHTSVRILTVSNFAKSELIKWYGAKPDNITVTYLGSEHILRVESDKNILSKHKLSPRKYVLSVGSNNPNKNFARFVGALDVLEGTDIQVAIAGPPSLKIFGANRTVSEKVRDLGYVSDSELRALYENAACFVFPSLYEGFGLPPLEALALGCPIVVSKTTALKEIFSGIASLCDPTSSNDIGAKILQVVSTDNNSAALVNFASKYSWYTCGLETWKVLCTLLASYK